MKNKLKIEFDYDEHLSPVNCKIYLNDEPIELIQDLSIKVSTQSLIPEINFTFPIVDSNVNSWINATVHNTVTKLLNSSKDIMIQLEEIK